MKTSSQKISFDLSYPLFLFLEQQKQKKKKSRANVLEEALILLQQQILEEEYKEASELQKKEIKTLDTLSYDGLTDESW